MKYRQNSKGMKRILFRLLMIQLILPSGMTVQWWLLDVNEDCNVIDDCLKIRKIDSLAKPMATALLGYANSCVGICKMSLWSHWNGRKYKQIYFRDSMEVLILGQASVLYSLTPLPLVPHICVSESSQHWFRINGLSPIQHQAII